MALGAGVLCAAASLAHADPAFDSFQKLCLDKNGERAAALAAADASGWMPIPKSMLDQFATSKNDSTGKMSDADGRLHTDAGGMTFLIVAKADRISPHTVVAADICAVAQMPADPAAVKAAAAAYAAVPSSSAVVDDKGSTGYVWRNEAGRHVAVSEADLAHAAEDHNVNVMLVGAPGGAAMIALAVPAK